MLEFRGRLLSQFFGGSGAFIGQHSIKSLATHGLISPAAREIKGMAKYQATLSPLVKEAAQRQKG